MTLVLTARHAELIGSRMVEPGGTFEPKDADPAQIERLKADGKVREVKASKKGGDS